MNSSQHGSNKWERPLCAGDADPQMIPPGREQETLKALVSWQESPQCQGHQEEVLREAALAAEAQVLPLQSPFPAWEVALR